MPKLWQSPLQHRCLVCQKRISRTARKGLCTKHVHLLQKHHVWMLTPLNMMDTTATCETCGLTASIGERTGGKIGECPKAFEKLRQVGVQFD